MEGLPSVYKNLLISFTCIINIIIIIIIRQDFQIAMINVFNNYRYFLGKKVFYSQWQYILKVGCHVLTSIHSSDACQVLWTGLNLAVLSYSSDNIINPPADGEVMFTGYKARRLCHSQWQISSRVTYQHDLMRDQCIFHLWPAVGSFSGLGEALLFEGKSC